MNEVLVGYEIYSTLTKEKNKLIGLSEEQIGCFKYENESAGKTYFSDIHISHFIVGKYIVVYNGTYMLKSDEAVYLFKDIGGDWK